MSAFLVFFAMTLIINQLLIKGIEWTVEQQVFTYGQNLTLFCKIGNCCFYTAGWDRWSSKEPTPIYIDVRNLKDASGDKYGGKANKSGIFLTIRDVKEVDLNTKYSCSYDFSVSEKKIVQKTDAFKDLEWVVDQKVSSYGHDLTLFCNVGTCCEYQYRWSKWKSVSNISPKNINENKDIIGKYNEKVNSSGFFLTIRNLREDDLNKGYACVYNNRLGKRQSLVKSDAFYISEESSITSTPHIEKEEGKQPLNLDLAIIIVFAFFAVVILSCFGFFVIQKLGFSQNAPYRATEHPVNSSTQPLFMMDNRNAIMAYPVPIPNSPSAVSVQNTSLVSATRPLSEGDKNTEMTYQPYQWGPQYVLVERKNAEMPYPASRPTSQSSVPEHNTSSACSESSTQPLLAEDKNADYLVIHAT